jgi:acetyl-CoA acetyltransferase
VKPSLAIVGLGVVRPNVGEKPPDRQLRRDALDLALADAGLQRGQLDGYVSADVLEDLRYLGLTPNFNVVAQSGGASVATGIVLAGGAIAMAQAKHVAITFSRAPSSGGMRTGTYAYGYPTLFGLFGPPASHALHARRHIHLYGTTSLQMAAVAVTQRDYALRRPMAVGFGNPMTIEDHQASPMVVDPFRRLDCCRDSDIGVAIIVTSAERSTDLASKPVQVAGVGFGHNIANWFEGDVYAQHDNVKPAAIQAFATAGLTLEDVDVAELYDPHTMSVIMQLEHYGFCDPGEGGPFVADGQTRLGGRIPTNTGGGQLSGWYAAGFTPLVEAVHQVRGTAGPGQIDDVEVALVSGHGGNAGVQNTWAHSTMLLTKNS